MPYTVLTGTDASETIVGDGFDNVIYGLGGNDTLIGLGGNDDDTLIGGPASPGGVNQLWGGAGNDTASFSDNIGGVDGNLEMQLAYP